MRANLFVQLRLLLALCLASTLALPAVAQREPAADPAAAEADPTGESKLDDVPAKKPEPPSGSGGTPSTGAETATAVPSAPPVDPKLVRVSLVDGSLIVGKFSIEEITVETEFGTLTIPITKIVRFTPGLDSHPELREQIQQLVQDLGGDDDRNRETAQLALVKMGLPVRSQLREHRESANAELSRRVKAILADLDRLAEDLEEVQPGGPTEWIREDTVVTADFTVVGRVSPQQFTVQNRFGTLNIPIGDIKVVSRKVKSGLEDVRKSLSLDGTYLAQQKYKSSGVQVQKGDTVYRSIAGAIRDPLGD